MGPYCPAIIRVSSTLSCIEDVYVIHIAVAIMVVLREIHFCIYRLHCRLDEGTHIYRGVIGTLSGIVLSVIYLHGTIHIKGWLKGSVGTCNEIVSYTSVGSVLCSEAFLVHRIIIILRSIFYCRELLVVKLHEDNDRVLLTHMRKVVDEHL